MIIAIDIGGTNIRIARAKRNDSKPIFRPLIIPNTPDYEKNIAKVIRIIKELRLTNTIDFIGISTPGKFKNGVMYHSTNMKAWVGHESIDRTLSKIFDCATKIANDTECAALGEAHFGDTNSAFCFINYGTGLSSASVTISNNTPTAVRVSDDIKETYFLKWQADCSGKGIENEFGLTAALLDDTKWNIIIGRFVLHLKSYLEYARPQQVVFGGGVATKQWARIENSLKQAQAEGLLDPKIDFKLTSLGKFAGLYGAYALAK